MGELVKGEGIRGCYGGVEHENGGGRLRGLLQLATQQLAAVVGGKMPLLLPLGGRRSLVAARGRVDVGLLLMVTWRMNVGLLLGWLCRQLPVRGVKYQVVFQNRKLQLV